MKPLLPACVTLLFLALPGARADDWPQWLGPKRDSVWRETGIIDKFPEGGPKVKWRAPVAWGYAGPAVAGGKIYVADFVTDADIRKLNSPAPSSKKVSGTERVLCLDAATGKELWKREDATAYQVSYPGGPRCTPTVHDGKVYTLGAEGRLLCLDAASGKEVWAKDFKKDYAAKTPFWGFSGHPLVEGDKLICVVGGDPVAVAFDRNTGKELWKALTAKEPGYCPPTLIEAGGKKQVVIWHATSINGLDPETGKVYWSVPLDPNFAMAIATPRQVGDTLFATGYGKAVLLDLAKDKPEVKEVWRGKPSTALYAINATPFVEDGMIYGVDQPGQLRGVKLETGERVWDTSDPVSGTKRPQGSGTAFLVKNGDRFFLFNETGNLIIARLTAKGYEEVSRWKMLEPTNNAFGRDVVWSHPAFADKCVFARNDKEIVCASLASEGGK